MMATSETKQHESDRRDEDEQDRKNHQEDRASWYRAKDWSEVIQLNIKFIRESAAGHYVNTPYHLGPLDPEIRPLVPALLRLHHFGLLTTGIQSQASTVWSAHGRYHELQKYPCLDFLLPVTDEAARLFVTRLLKDESLITKAIDYKPSPPKFWPESADAERVAVARSREGQSEEELSTADWAI
jgi:hypothetical protein